MLSKESVHWDRLAKMQTRLAAKGLGVEYPWIILNWEKQVEGYKGVP